MDLLRETVIHFEPPEMSSQVDVSPSVLPRNGSIQHRSEQSVEDPREEDLNVTSHSNTFLPGPSNATEPSDSSGTDPNETSTIEQDTTIHEDDPIEPARKEYP